MPLLNPSKTPPGGFQYFIPQLGPVGWWLPNPVSHTLESAAKLVLQQHLVNPRFNLPTEFATVKSMVEEYQCRRLKYDPAWCCPESESLKKNSNQILSLDQFPQAQPSAASAAAVATAPLAERISKLAAGSQILRDWWGEGGLPVSKTLAEARASVCVRCGCNQKGDWLNKVPSTIAGAILEQRRCKDKLQMRVSQEAQIMTCNACECHLPLKVWVPLSNIEPFTSDKTWKRLPQHCWMQTEARSPIVVFPFCPFDLELAIKNLTWQKSLGGCPKHRALLVAAIQVSESNRKKVRELAEQVFAHVDLITTPKELENERWPIGANYMFKTAAEWLADSRSPFFWHEPDAWPLRSGWMDELEREYYQHGKPFMGCIVPCDQPGLPAKSLAGVAIYPPRTFDLLGAQIKTTGDCRGCDAWDVATAGLVVDKAQHTNRIFHFWGQKDKAPFIVPWTMPDQVENAFPLTRVPPEAVIFHRCKDDSLVNTIQPRITVRESPLTVVITNWGRPAHVWKAFESCRAVGVRNIVISSSSCNAELERVHQRIKAIKPDVIINAIAGDNGCNEMWLRGVKLAKTPWIHILHDDDTLLPAFAKVEERITHKMGFMHWNAKTDKTLPDRPSGVYPIDVYRPLTAREYSMSPIMGLFRKEHLIEVLEKAETVRDKFLLRPGMMIGNDLIIWLAAVDKYNRFYYLNDACVDYGYWEGSTTVDDVQGRKLRIKPLFDAFKVWYRENHPTDRKPIIWHVFEQHRVSEQSERDRREIVWQSWNNLYSQGTVKPVPLSMPYLRDSRKIGGKRSLPYVKDVLENGLTCARDNDVIMFTNDDIILHRRLPELVFDALERWPAVSSHRAEYGAIIGAHLVKDDPAVFKSAVPHPGRDVFAFRAGWLRTHLHEIPDYLVGAPCWDTAMAAYIRHAAGFPGINRTKNSQCIDAELPFGFCAHIMHHAAWTINKMSDKCNAHNAALATAQLKRLYPTSTEDLMTI